MIKKQFFTAMALLAGAQLFAGGLLTNTNQSIHFLRNPARNASTEIDAVYTNPAGLTFLTDGLHLSLNSQSVFQTRTITSTFAPFTYGNSGNPIKTFNGEAAAPIVPSFQLAYKKDKFVFSTSLAITGGGGKATFNDGLASFESKIAGSAAQLVAGGVDIVDYSVDSYLEGKQYIFGWQMNGSYKINDNLSAAVGLRMNIVNSGYNGYLRNINFKVGTSDMTINALYAFLANKSTTTANSLAPLAASPKTISQLKEAGFLTEDNVASLSKGLGGINIDNLTAAQVQAGYTTAAASYTTASTTNQDKELDCEQTGWGITPIISINYHISNLNLAARYEFKSSLNIQNNTKSNTTGVAAYDHGVNTPHDIPALLSLGAAYDISKSLKLSAGYHHFFDSDAKMANNKQQYIDGGINEYLLGAEYKITDKFLLSAGGQLTRTGVTDMYQTDMSYSLNSYSVGFGGAYNITPSLRLNLAYFFTNYSDWTKESANYNGTGIKGTDVYARTNKVFGVGIDYKF